MSELAFTKSDQRTVIRHKAMDLLARREHGREELRRKLLQRFPEDGDLLGDVLTKLAEENLQSDSRFAENFLSARVARGQGPQRIALELRQRGVSDHHIETQLAACEVDWYQLAQQVVVKKYGTKPCSDFSERSKRSRFLQYRGFDSCHIKAVVIP